MIKIGITGSLSSGKSAVAKLMSRNKYPLFDADKAVVGLYKKRDFIKKIKKKFNFKNTKKDKKKLKELESIIHPLVRKEMRALMKPRKNIKISIFEIPLLIESKLTKYFNVVVFVGANKNIRLKRYLYRGGNKKIFTILDNRQIKPSKKIKISNHVIYNNKSLKVLKKNVKLLMNKYE